MVVCSSAYCGQWSDWICGSRLSAVREESRTKCAWCWTVCHASLSCFQGMMCTSFNIISKICFVATSVLRIFLTVNCCAFCLQCFDAVGWEGHPACKNMEWWGAGVVICLERGANDLHMVQLMLLPPHHLLLQQNPEWLSFWYRPTQVVWKKGR